MARIQASRDRNGVVERRIGAYHGTGLASHEGNAALDAQASSVEWIDGTALLYRQSPPPIPLLAMRALHDIGTIDHISAHARASADEGIGPNKGRLAGCRRTDARRTKRADQYQDKVTPLGHRPIILTLSVVRRAWKSRARSRSPVVFS